MVDGKDRLVNLIIEGISKDQIFPATPREMVSDALVSANACEVRVLSRNGLGKPLVVAGKVSR